jgi:hypothetical protein
MPSIDFAIIKIIFTTSGDPIKTLNQHAVRISLSTLATLTLEWAAARRRRLLFLSSGIKEDWDVVSLSIFLFLLPLPFMSARVPVESVKAMVEERKKVVWIRIEWSLAEEEEEEEEEEDEEEECIWEVGP